MYIINHFGCNFNNLKERVIDKNTSMKIFYFVILYCLHWVIASDNTLPVGRYAMYNSKPSKKIIYIEVKFGYHGIPAGKVTITINKIRNIIDAFRN